MIEASLQSASAMGNFGDDETEVGVEESTESTEAAAGATAAAKSVEKARAAHDVRFPLRFKGTKAFILSCFPAFSADYDDQRVAHLSYLVEMALDVWWKEASTSAAVLQDAATARETLQTGRNPALVSVDVPGMNCLEAKFIHWQNKGESGRPIQLDQQHRVKALVCVGELRQALDISNSFVIHPDTGVSMQRARGYRFHERPIMPLQMRRLQAVCQRGLQLHALHAGGGQEEMVDHAVDVLGSGDCALCSGSNRVRGVPIPSQLGEGSEPAVPASQCPCCLQPPCLQYGMAGN